MIVADTRHRLTRDDAELVLQLIAGGSRDEQLRGESILRDGGIDELLDDPRLLPALLERRQGSRASLPLLAYVLVREALCRSGERDRGLADYVTSILLHFGFGGRAQRITAYDDEIYDTLATLLRDVDVGDPTRAFLVRAQLGNYALWLSGIFPDFIESMRFRRGGPDLDYYENMGRRGYELAAEHTLASRYGMRDLYVTVAERFPQVRVALNRVSDQFLFPNTHSPDKLLRQVRDQGRWKPT
ncbi:MAG: hypothetical protein ABI877_04710 [Gemmatimonadaceae bacterium]